MTDMQVKRSARGQSPARSKRVAILGIGTASPSALRQADATAYAERFSCETDGQRTWLRRVFSRAGVEQRGSVLCNTPGGVESFYGLPAEIGAQGPTTETRMKRYALEAPPLMERAARAALAAAQVTPDAITQVITVSCTGFFAPGLDVELITRLGLRRNVQRRHIGFMGCHAAFNALGAARDAVRADPDAVVLVCCVELSTLHFAYGWNPEKLVANALFGDGASACVVGATQRQAEDGGSGAGEWQLVDTASLLLPESREAMTWRIGDHGFEMTLSAALPELIGTHIRPWCERWLGERDLQLEDIAHWAIHPGGPRILAAAREALGLPDAALKPSYQVLAEQGNMSSATVLFLLQRIGAEPQARGRCVAIGFGPGLMAEGMLLER